MVESGGNPSTFYQYPSTKKHMEIIIHDIEALDKAVNALFHFSKNKKKWLFYGEIGAGKTTFIQAIGQHLGVKEQVVSPTFSLVNEYSYWDSSTEREQYVHHLDLYRLKDTQEAVDIGIEDMLFDNDYCFVEWAEIIEPILPDEVVKIYIEIFENSQRKFIFI